MGLPLARRIDHTLLKAEATAHHIATLCDEALQYGFAAVCVNPSNMFDILHHLRGSDVKTCCVVGFPLGANDSRTKAFEAERAAGAGIQEIDMVINIGALKYTASSFVGEEIKAVRKAFPSPGILKVIIESAALTEKEIRTASILCANNGADFVKTSTGFHPLGGAKVEHVRLIKDTIGNRAEIKASGGIKTYADMMKFIEAGATRIGTSSGVSILDEAMGSQASS